MSSPQPVDKEPLRLHIGGREARPGWKILNIQPGEDVDFVGNCADLSQFEDESAAEVYASHVLEHLGYQLELPRCLAEIYRILKPGGRLLVSVPDLAILCKMFVDPQHTFQDRVQIMRIIMGGQMNEFDFHKVGFDLEILMSLGTMAGFKRIERVKRFNLFADISTLQLHGQEVCLNVIFGK